MGQADREPSFSREVVPTIGRYIRRDRRPGCISSHCHETTCLTGRVRAEARSTADLRTSRAGAPSIPRLRILPGVASPLASTLATTLVTNLATTLASDSASILASILVGLVHGLRAQTIGIRPAINSACAIDPAEAIERTEAMDAVRAIECDQSPVGCQNAAARGPRRLGWTAQVLAVGLDTNASAQRFGFQVAATIVRHLGVSWLWVRGQNGQSV